MPKKRIYSIYEAKAHFSEILRRVRERGETITVSYRGEPVAEIRPALRTEGNPLEVRIRELEERGAVMAAQPTGALAAAARRRGALARFVAEREED